MNRTPIVAGLAFAVFASQANAGIKATTISINGSCDVYTVTIQDRRLAAAVETDPDGRCETFLGGGHLARAKGAGHVATVGGIFDNNPNIVFTLDIQYPFLTGGTWHLYSTTDGSVMQDVASGTYTVSAPGTQTGRGGRRLGDLRHP